MEKTLLEKFAEKLADGFIEVGNDMKMLLKISKPTAEGQVLTAKMVDGELQPVWADSGASVPDTPDTPDNTGMFDPLTNCTYENDMLNYTSGDLDFAGMPGYQAVSNTPKNIELINKCDDGTFAIYISVGEGVSLLDYMQSDMGLVFALQPDSSVMLKSGNDEMAIIDFTVNQNDKIQVTIADSKATITNVTTGQSFTTGTSEYLANPKYLNVVVIGTNPLPIKAI